VDDGRLELDDDGQVLDALGDDAVVDLGDPDATEAIAASRVDAWLSGTAAGWMSRHRRLATAGVSTLVVVALGSAWWVSRPAPPPPPPPVTATDAGVSSSDQGGARIDDAGDLAVAYSVRAGEPGTRFDVLSLAGPGLAGGTVSATGASGSAVTADSLTRVEARAAVQCDDPSIATARPADYGLLVRPQGTGQAPTLVPFGSSTTRLDVAVRDHCLASAVPRQVSVVEARLDPASGSVMTLRLVVRNTGRVPVTIATQRRVDAGVEVDRSQTATLVGGGTAVLQTRLLVHDCTTTPRIGSVLDDPGPVPTQGYSDPFSQPGITVDLALGGQIVAVSYPLPTTIAAMGKALGAAACTGRPTVTADLVSASGGRAPDGSWYVDGTIRVQTSGIGVSVGREHFAGPAWGSGSTLVTGGPVTPNSPWSVTPVQLDGGAGHLVVRFTGSSCDVYGGAAPDHLALRVIDAARTAFPFDVPLDAFTLQRAVIAACSTFTASSP
jgi:hypothetical protein